MSRIRLTLRKPSVFGAELFTFPDEIDTWTETDSGTVTISVQTVSSRTFMRFVTTAVTEGVYKDFTVTAGQKISCSFFVKSTSFSDNFTAIFYDQTNGAAITTYTPHTVDTTWRCFEVEVTAPTGCTTIRVTLNGVVADTYEIDSFAFNKDEIVIQPSGPGGYEGNPDIVGVVKQSLRGNRIQHRLGTHWRYTLRWNFVEDAFFDRMVLLYESGEALYLDDSDVPDLTERSTLYTNASYDHTGIINPSITHVGYYTESADLPTSAAQFQDTEYPTTWYTDIAAGTLRSHEYSASKYLYHKFIFRPAEYGTGIQRLKINIKTILDDLATANNDGILAYVWNGSNWQEIIRTSSPTAEDIDWYTYSSDEAQSMIPQDGVASNGILRVLVRTRPYGGLLSDHTVGVTMSVDETLTANVASQLSLNTVGWDSEDLYDNASYRFTAQAAGYYLVDFQVKFKVNAAADACIATVRLNGATAGAFSAYTVAHDGGSESISASKVLFLSAGDYLELWATNESNNDLVDKADTYFDITALTAVELDTSLGMYDVNIETNPGLGAVEPTHRMWFENNSESGDIEIKNRTLGTTLTTSDYSVDYENNQLDITGQSDGDVVEMTYSRFREVRIAQMPERRQHDNPDGSVRHGMDVSLETITPE